MVGLRLLLRCKSSYALDTLKLTLKILPKYAKVPSMDLRGA